MPSKKTGLYISPVNQPIIEKVMSDYGYTKISNCINFIISDWARLKNEECKDNQQKHEPPVEEEPQRDFSGWFVAEDKQ